MKFHIYLHSEADPGLARLDAIDGRLDLILENMETQMSQADDLNNMVTALTTGYAALHDAVQVQADALTAALAKAAAAAQPDPATAKAMSDAIANITAVTGSMATQ